MNADVVAPSPGREQFATSLGAGYTLTSAAGSIAAELVSCTEGPPSDRVETFTLLFHARSARPAEQGTYRAEHTGLGTFDVFLVPVARDAGGVDLEAVFNRLIPDLEA